MIRGAILDCLEQLRRDVALGDLPDALLGPIATGLRPVMELAESHRKYRTGIMCPDCGSRAIEPTPVYDYECTQCGAQWYAERSHAA